MIIEAENLQKQYPEVLALNKVDLKVAQHGIVGLLGPNGAGKTTLVEIIEGLRSRTAGNLSVLGLDPRESSSQLKERLGVQLQSTPLHPDLTPIETLNLFAAFFQKSLPSREILERVSLKEKAKSRNRTLSGGQKQRLAIGLALVNDPELLILDEPTTGLDPIARRGVHDIVASLKEQGRTVILTTHYIEEAEKLCDRVIMIRAGEIVADATPLELISRAGGMSTIWIAVDEKFDPSPLLSTGATDQGREGEYYRFATSDPTSAVLALGEILKAQKLTLRDLRMKRPTLEDVYIDLVGEIAPEEEPLQE